MPVSPFSETRKNNGFWGRWTMQRAYLSCLYRGLVSIPPLFLKSSVSARFLRNSSPKITKSRVQSPCRFVYFFPLTSRFLESSARNLRRLGCGANVKLLDGLPPRPSQWKFVLENYCLAQGFLWEQNVSQLLILQWQCVQYLRLTLSSSACAPVLIFLNKYKCVYSSPPRGSFKSQPEGW